MQDEDSGKKKWNSASDVHKALDSNKKNKNKKTNEK